MATAQERLDSALITWLDLWRDWAASGELSRAATHVLDLDGENALPQAKGRLKSFEAQWKAGVTENLPEIIILPEEDMNGALGAYAVSTTTIYLSEAFLEEADVEAILDVLTHEMGHFLDAQLNEADTPGEEGDAFARILNGRESSSSIDPSEDTTEGFGKILLEGEEIDTENAALEIGSGYAKLIMKSAYQNGANGTPSIFRTVNIENTYGQWNPPRTVMREFNENGDLLNTFSIPQTPHGNYFRGWGDRIHSYSGFNLYGWETQYSRGFFQAWQPSYTMHLDYKVYQNNINVTTLGWASVSGGLYSGINGPMLYGGEGINVNNADFAIRAYDSLYYSPFFNNGFPLRIDISGGYDVIRHGISLRNGGFVFVGEASPGLGIVKLLSNGSRDSTFSQNGILYDPNLSHADRVVELLDGSLVIGSRNTLMKLSAAGELDTSFGVNGIAQIPGLSNSYFSIKSLEILPSGSILVNASMAITTDGSLDVSFGSNGYVQDGSGNTVGITPSYVARFGGDSFLYAAGSNQFGKLLTTGILEDDFLVNQAPTDLSLASSGVLENSAEGILVGKLSAKDSWPSTNFSYSLAKGDGANDIDNDKVYILGSNVFVSAGALVDFELSSQLNLYIQVSDGSLSLAKDFRVDVIDVNEQPTDLVLSAITFDENILAGSTVAILSAADPDASESFNFEIVAGFGDASAFSIDGDQLTILASPDYESQGTYNLRIRTTDSGGLSLDKDVQLTVKDLFEFSVGVSSSDAPNVSITGNAGPTNMSQVESFTIQKVVTGKGKERTVELIPEFTEIDSFGREGSPGVDGITFTAGASDNVITATAVDGDPLRTAFNGQLMIFGGYGVDQITGGSVLNWLQGGGIVDPLSTDSTDAVESLVGSDTAIDVFDLRSYDFQSDAYAAANSGSALIRNYDQVNDYIALAKSSGDYVFAPIQTTSGKGKKNQVTLFTGYEIFDGSKLIAIVNHASGAELTGDSVNDLNILYGTEHPAEVFIGGSQLFFLTQ